MNPRLLVLAGLLLAAAPASAQDPTGPTGSGTSGGGTSTSSQDPSNVRAVVTDVLAGRVEGVDRPDALILVADASTRRLSPPESV